MVIFLRPEKRLDSRVEEHQFQKRRPTISASTHRLYVQLFPSQTNWILCKFPNRTLNAPFSIIAAYVLVVHRECHCHIQGAIWQIWHCNALVHQTKNESAGPPVAWLWTKVFTVSKCILDPLTGISIGRICSLKGFKFAVKFFLFVQNGPRVISYKHFWWEFFLLSRKIVYLPESARGVTFFVSGVSFFHAFHHAKFPFLSLQRCPKWFPVNPPSLFATLTSGKFLGEERHLPPNSSHGEVALRTSFTKYLPNCTPQIKDAIWKWESLGRFRLETIFFRIQPFNIMDVQNLTRPLRFHFTAQ